MATKQMDFINAISDGVISAVSSSGLFPSLMIAQAILESGWGKSALSSKHNNYFGIKADKSWKGAKAIFKTREVIDGKEVYVDAAFRSYADAKQGFKDRIEFLLKNPRYTKHGVFAAKTPEEQAQALQRAGYATDPKYASILSGIISKYNLKVFDELKKKENTSL